jgi:hypothetical protein
LQKPYTVADLRQALLLALAQGPGLARVLPSHQVSWLAMAERWRGKWLIVYKWSSIYEAFVTVKS